MKKTVYWHGIIEENDDFGDEVKDVIIDGRTNMGPWAMMTEKSFKRYGVGLGQGKGQKYKKQADNNWLKVEG